MIDPCMDDPTFLRSLAREEWRDDEDKKRLAKVADRMELLMLRAEPLPGGRGFQEQRRRRIAYLESRVR